MALNIKYDVLLGALRESDMIAILSTHIFATTTERDAYFSPDALNEIVPGLEIIVGASIFRWAGQTPANAGEYTSNLSNWVNVTSASLTATQIKSLYESNADTNALIDSKNTILNALQIVGDELQVIDLDLFVRELRTNTGTISLDDSVTIRSNSQGLDLQHNARNEFCEVIVSKYDNTGSEIPQYPEKGALITNVLQALSDTTNADFNFTRQVAIKSHFMGFTVNPAAIGSGTFNIRLGTSTGAVLVTETTIDFTTADTDHSFLLSNPIKVNANDVLWVNYSGVALNGSVLSGVSGFSDGFVPVLSTSIHPETDKAIATQEYVNNHSNLFTDADRNKLAGIEDNANNYVLPSDVARDSDIRTDAQIQDIIGAMVTGNVETGIDVTYDATGRKLNFVVSSTPPTPTEIYRIHTQTNTTVTQAIIEAFPDNATALPYRYFLTTPLNDYMVVAWHSSTSVSDIHVNILDSDAVESDIDTSPLGNRFVQSQVQTAGVYEYQILDISGDISLLGTGQKIGIYLG